jgi:MoaA/NifB/PqqE/SkfB family radical SAM enzyme
MFKEFEGRIVKIMSCSNCNTKCKHCYISYKGSFTPEDLYEVVRNLKKKYKLKINGTEPLLTTGYLKSFKEAGEEMVLTNGLVFKDNEKYLEEIKAAGIKQICISYHFELHDLISSVDKKYIERLIPIVRSYGFKVEVMTTISSINYNKVIEYCDKAYAMGATNIHFTNYMVQGRAKSGDKSLMLTEDQRREFFRQLMLAREKYDINDLTITRCGTFDKNPFQENGGNFRCLAYNEMVVLTPELKVYPCNFQASPGNEIGFYKDGKIYIDDSLTFNPNECSSYCKYCK